MEFHLKNETKKNSSFSIIAEIYCTSVGERLDFDGVSCTFR